MEIGLIIVLSILLVIILGVMLKSKKKDFPCAVCGTPLSTENCKKDFPCAVCGTPLSKENCSRDFPCPGCPTCVSASCPRPATLINCKEFTGPTGCNELNISTCGPY